MARIDLHMHSSWSDDADLSVNDLINRCVKQGVSTLSITDHNSVDSVAEALKFSSDKLTVLPGIEIDCSFQGRNFHLLGYGIDHHSSDFELIKNNFSELQQHLVPVKMDKLRGLGFHLDEKELFLITAGRIPAEEQMAEVILQDEKNQDHSLLKPYREGGARSDMPLINFYWDFFGFGKACYVAVEYSPLAKMVEVIKSNGGIPVIAHIGANINSNYHDVLNAMFTEGVMGVEVYSSYHDTKLAQLLLDYVIGRSAYMTCGSDFHGKNKPKIEVGTCQYDAKAEQMISQFVEQALG